MSKIYGSKNIIFSGIIMPGPILTEGKFWQKEIKNPIKVQKYLNKNFSLKRL